MRKLNFINFLFVIGLVAFIGSISNTLNAQEDTSFKSAGTWLIGLKVLNLDPDVDSSVSIGGGAVVDDDTVPELDIRYFITDTLAIEAIFGTTEHKVSAKSTALGDVNLGTIRFYLQHLHCNIISKLREISNLILVPELIILSSMMAILVNLIALNIRMR